MITGNYKCKTCQSSHFKLLQESYKPIWAGTIQKRVVLRCEGCRKTFNIGTVDMIEFEEEEYIR